MTTLLAKDPVDRATVVAWVRSQLMGGGDLAALLMRRLPSLPVGFLVVPAHATFETPWILNNKPATWPFPHRRLERIEFLTRAARLGLVTLIIEDDVRIEGGPHLPQSIVFTKGRALQWTDLSSPETALANANAASTGYPFVAVASALSPNRLGLSPGGHLSKDELEGVVSATSLLLVSAFDGDAYVGLASRELEQGLRD